MHLRDPVHGLMAFEGEEERVLLALLGCAEVQRLRNIRQLGLAAWVFPGAEHSRFTHALGTACIMSRLLVRVRETSLGIREVDDELSRDAFAAALLHDLGHGPFSHLFEELVPQGARHEDWTLRLLRDPETRVHSALESLSHGMAERVSALLEGTHPAKFMTAALAGTLDVDRCDYLLRDSHMTGVRYGLFDLDWILRVVHLVEDSGELSWAVDGRKSISPLESYFLGRHYMYQQVYHHKAVRAAESAVRALLARVRELLESGAAPAMPAALQHWCEGKLENSQEYLQLDDPLLLYILSTWLKAEDDTLRRYAAAVRLRRFPKTIPLSELPEQRWEEALDLAREIATDQNFRPDLEAVLDLPCHVPYAEVAETELRIDLGAQSLRKPSELSDVLKALLNRRVKTPRLVVPEPCHAALSAALRGMSP